MQRKIVKNSNIGGYKIWNTATGRWYDTTIYDSKKEANKAIALYLKSKSAVNFRTGKKLTRRQLQAVSVLKKNPHGFCIVDQHLNKIASGKDYDKLQDRVDRHNEDHDEKWFVIDESDYKEMKTQKRNPNNYRVVKYGKEWAILDSESRAYILFGTKREMEKRARELNRMDDKPTRNSGHITRSDFHRISNDVNGNPRYVISWFRIADTYANALAIARKIGGRKYNTKKFGGGIVFQSYNIDEEINYLNQHIKNPVQNVSMGFTDSHGVFHPVRASYDYDEDRADENYRPRPVRKYARKEKAFKKSQTKRNSRARFWNGHKEYNLIGVAEFMREYGVNHTREKLRDRLLPSETENAIKEARQYLDSRIKQTRRNAKIDHYAIYQFDYNNNTWNHAENTDTLSNAKDVAEELSERHRGTFAVMSVDYYGTEKRVATYRLGKRANSNKNPNVNESELFNIDKIDKLSGIFQGHINGKQIKTVGSDFTPPLTARLGRLAYIKLKNGKEHYEINFKNNGDAWLSADARKNLYLEGKDARIANAATPKKGSLTWLGQVEQINYRTNKSHIENGDLVEYYHQLGEVDGIKPNAFLDHDGFILLTGGNYDIDVHGIEN